MLHHHRLLLQQQLHKFQNLKTRKIRDEKLCQVQVQQQLLHYQKQSINNTNLTRPTSSGQSITEEALSSHVHKRYTNAQKRNLNLPTSGEETSEETDSTTSSTQESQKYLRELNRRPALVLNADYMVSENTNEKENE